MRYGAMTGRDARDDTREPFHIRLHEKKDRSQPFPTLLRKLHTQE